VLLILCILGIIVITGLSELSAREYLFLSILLAGLSIGASWIGTNAASKSNVEQMRESLKKDYIENLRTYALKAAEKVQNLSAEMQRLIDYVKESSPSGEETAVKMAAERLKTVSLMLETIKSVNDTALSDWRGVIGDELRKQEKIQTDIDEIFSKIEDLEEAVATPTEPRGQIWLPGMGVATADVPGSEMALHDLASRLKDIDKDVLKYASSSPIPVRMPRRKKIDVIIKCPNCESENQTRVNMREGYKKVTRCRNCGTYFTITVNSDLNIGTERIETKNTMVKCVLCDEEQSVNFPVWPGYVLHYGCPKCQSVIYASVGGDEELHHRQSEKISKKFLDIIEQMVESQYPSEDDISAIAREIGVSKAKVTQCVTVLLNLGRIEGPEEENEEEVEKQVNK
jgi:transcription elongation factor Elf1